MVSNASDDFPEPETPVITTSLSRGISRSIPFRLCSRAPRMTILPLDIDSLSPKMPSQEFSAKSNLYYNPLLSKLGLEVEPPPAMVWMDGCPTPQPERRLNSESVHERVQPAPPALLASRL